MSHHALREDKTCLNCRHVVTERFCSHCGQENAQTKQSFWYLFVHFIEDFTHYEGNFWRTVRQLLFNPGYLTNTYLSGKRMHYLPPVRLYIFVSFISFLVFGMLQKSYSENDTLVHVPAFETLKVDSVFVWKKDTLPLSNLGQMVHESKLSVAQADSISYAFNQRYRVKQRQMLNLQYQSQVQLDSARIADPTMSDFKYNLHKKAIFFTDKYTFDEIKSIVLDRFFAFMPKVLFFYLPFFAFLMWLFYRNKRSYYFEHGIFTLHYFSFALVLFMVLFILDRLALLIPYQRIYAALTLFIAFFYFWMPVYFFIACYRVFPSSKLAVILKSSLLIFINTVILFCIFIGLFLYLLYNIN